MRLSQHAIDLILAIVAQFDRERGIPHDYLDLEEKLKGLSYAEREDGQLDVEIPVKAGHPRSCITVDARALLVEASKEW
jgi:hypothetical protein